MKWNEKKTGFILNDFSPSEPLTVDPLFLRMFYGKSMIHFLNFACEVNDRHYKKKNEKKSKILIKKCSSNQNSSKQKTNLGMFSHFGPIGSHKIRLAWYRNRIITKWNIQKQLNENIYINNYLKCCLSHVINFAAVILTNWFAGPFYHM